VRKINGFIHYAAPIKITVVMLLKYVLKGRITFFKKIYCEVISKRIWIIFAPEEAEIFKDYLLF
jgi:hypothetical protein